MFDKLTEKAQKVLRGARLEAQKMGHQFIGTEHLLLGLVREGTGVASTVLQRLGADPKRIRAKVSELAPSGDPPVAAGSEASLAAGAQEACAHAAEEARLMERNYIGTEHLLLGLLHDADSIAARVLTAVGVGYDGARECIVDLLSHEEKGAKATVRPRRGIAETVQDIQKQVDELRRDQQALGDIPAALQKIQEQLDEIKRLLSSS